MFVSDCLYRSNPKGRVFSVNLIALVCFSYFISHPILFFQHPSVRMSKPTVPRSGCPVWEPLKRIVSQPEPT